MNTTPDNPPAEPLLGLATTRQLLDELAARIDGDYSNGGGGLDYTTVAGRPTMGIASTLDDAEAQQ